MGHAQMTVATHDDQIEGVCDEIKDALMALDANGTQDDYDCAVDALLQASRLVDSLLPDDD